VSILGRRELGCYGTAYSTSQQLAHTHTYIYIYIYIDLKNRNKPQIFVCLCWPSWRTKQRGRRQTSINRQQELQTEIAEWHLASGMNLSRRTSVREVWKRH